MTNSYKIEFLFGLPKDMNGVYNYKLSDQIRSVTGAAANLFGGYTLIRHEGGWTSPEGKLVEEPSATLTVITSTVNWNVKDGWVNQLHDFIKETMRQEEVMVLKTSVEHIKY